MRVHPKVIFWAKVAGAIITLIGVIDLPDQIQDWMKWFQELRGNHVNWESNILGNAGRWAFTIVGLLVLLWAYRVPSLILARFSPDEDRKPIKEPTREPKPLEPAAATMDPPEQTRRTIGDLVSELRHLRRPSAMQTTMIRGLVRQMQVTPFEIEFDAKHYVDWLEEPHPSFPMQHVRRKCYWIVIHNKLKTEDVDNVSVEIERIEELPDRPQDSVEAAPYIGHKLRFQRSGQTTMKFSPDLRDQVRVASYGRGILMADSFRIEGFADEVFHNNHRHRLHIKVTGDGKMSATARFIVWVQDEVLQMVKEEEGTSG